MALVDKKKINRVFSLCKGKKSNKWQVGQWINQSLWSTDGNSKAICGYEDMRDWKYFQEVLEYTSQAPLKTGDRIVLKDRDSRSEWYYVITESGSNEQGSEFTYLIGL